MKEKKEGLSYQVTAELQDLIVVSQLQSVHCCMVMQSYLLCSTSHVTLLHGDAVISRITIFGGSCTDSHTLSRSRSLVSLLLYCYKCYNVNEISEYLVDSFSHERRLVMGLMFSWAAAWLWLSNPALSVCVWPETCQPAWLQWSSTGNWELYSTAMSVHRACSHWRWRHLYLLCPISSLLLFGELHEPSV